MLPIVVNSPINWKLPKLGKPTCLWPSSGSPPRLHRLAPLIAKSNSSNCTDIFNCQTQVQSNTLTFFEVPVSANPRFLICDYTFAPMRKCRFRFEVLPMKIFPSFSLKIKILAICNYISEKWLIAKVKIFKYTYLPSKNVMAEPQINDLHLMC